MTALSSVGNGLVDPRVASTVNAAEDVYLEQTLPAAGSFVNDGDTVLVVRNTDAGDKTIVFTTQTLDNMGTLVNKGTGSVTITVPDGGSAVIGPFDPFIFGVNPATRSVQGGAGTVADVTLVNFTTDGASFQGYTVKIVGKGILEASTDV